MQKKRGEAGHFPGSVVFNVTGVKDPFKGTRIAEEVGEGSKGQCEKSLIIFLKNMTFIWR